MDWEEYQPGEILELLQKQSLLAILCLSFLVCKMALVILFQTVSLCCEDRKIFIYIDKIFVECLI